MQIQLTVGLEGPEISLQAGDIYETDDAEAIRLIDAGFAIPFADKPVERTVKRLPAETRTVEEPVADPAPEPSSEPEAPAEPETPAEPEAVAEGEANA